MKNALENLWVLLPCCLFRGLPSFHWACSCLSSGFQNSCSNQSFKYVHSCNSLPSILSNLSSFKMLVQASHLFTECSLISFICSRNFQSGHSFLYSKFVHASCDLQSTSSGHLFVYSLFMPLVVSQNTHSGHSFIYIMLDHASRLPKWSFRPLICSQYLWSYLSLASKIFFCHSFVVCLFTPLIGCQDDSWGCSFVIYILDCVSHWFPVCRFMAVFFINKYCDWLIYYVIVSTDALNLFVVVQLDILSSFVLLGHASNRWVAW